MDGFAESEKSESETGFGFVKSNTALDYGEVTLQLSVVTVRSLCCGQHGLLCEVKR